MIKAKVIATGKIYKVETYNEQSEFVVLDTGQNHGTYYSLEEVEFLTIPSIEERRYELVKSCLSGILANPDQTMISMTDESAVNLAISCANITLKKLNYDS